MVRLKRKVTLRTKNSEPLILETPKSSRSVGKLLAVLGVLLLLSVGIFYWKSNTVDTVAQRPSLQFSSEETVAESPAQIESLGEAHPEVSPVKDVNSAMADAHKQIVSGTSKESASLKEAAPNKRSLNSSLPNDTIESMAQAVIRGVYGNGRERKERLKDQYPRVQQRVNELYREGKSQNTGY